jgi:hypothetical protein
MLAGCSSVYEMNVWVRPDRPLQRAFARASSADQSTIQRTLDAFTEEKVNELREAVEAIGKRHSRLPYHPYEREMLVVEVDLTGFRASKKAERSTKGYFSGSRNATGRQLVGASSPNYGRPSSARSIMATPIRARAKTLAHGVQARFPPNGWRTILRKVQ